MVLSRSDTPPRSKSSRALARYSSRPSGASPAISRSMMASTSAWLAPSPILAPSHQTPILPSSCSMVSYSMSSSSASSSSASVASGSTSPSSSGASTGSGTVSPASAVSSVVSSSVSASSSTRSVMRPSRNSKGSLRTVPSSNMTFTPRMPFWSQTSRTVPAREPSSMSTLTGVPISGNPTSLRTPLASAPASAACTASWPC